jgi:hypothetical protein
MSRTYRKRSVTEEESLVEYINKHISRVRGRRKWERYETESGRKAYQKAIEDWETEYGNWLWWPNRGSWYPPRQPLEYEFQNLRITYVEYNHDEEVEFATKEYKRYKRDGRFYESNRNRSYKKHCASDLRHLNRELANKIVKGDDRWEDKPYPDTYLCKQYIWDYW